MTKQAKHTPTQEVRFEWVIETLDEHGDIEDVNHSDTFPGFPEDGLNIGLVRDVYEWPENDPERKCDPDLASRSWAYIVDGKLPESFEYAGGGHAAKVPVKFHDEVAKARSQSL
jgi:hypothetical protein